jgi:hypothetical protein
VCTLKHDDLVHRAKPFVSLVNIALMDNNVRWSCIHSGQYNKWLQAGSKLMILAEAGFKVLEGTIERQGNDLFVAEDSLIRLVSDEVFWVGEPFQ